MLAYRLVHLYLLEAEVGRRKERNVHPLWFKERPHERTEVRRPKERIL